MTKSHLIKVCTMGIDNSFKQTLELVFEKYIKGFTLVKEQEAEACIFDFDDFHAKKRWDTYRKSYPHTPVLILSLHERNVPEKHFFVQKPVDLNHFIQVLEKLKHSLPQPPSHIETHITETPLPPKKELVLRVRKVEQKINQHEIHHAVESFEKQHIIASPSYIEHTACGHEPDINPHDEKALEKISYDRSRRLQGLIEKAVEIAINSGCVNRLKGTLGELLIDPAHRCVLCSVKEQTLHSLMLLPAKNLHIETQLLSPNQAKEYIKNSSTPFYHDYLDQFLWKTAILTSHGRVPIGTDVHAPVILSRWPNFTRLMITPHALQITALWADTPCSLLETADLLQIPQRYVFSLYSAMVALNLACVAPSISPRKKSFSFTVNPDKRSLFQRLLEKLSF